MLFSLIPPFLVPPSAIALPPHTTILLIGLLFQFFWWDRSHAIDQALWTWISPTLLLSFPLFRATHFSTCTLLRGGISPGTNYSLVIHDVTSFHQAYSTCCIKLFISSCHPSQAQRTIELSSAFQRDSLSCNRNNHFEHLLLSLHFTK